MKKFTICLVSLVLVAHLIPALGSAQFANPSGLTLQDLSQMLRTPEEIARFMWRNFRFENDRTQFGKEEYWQSPEEMLVSQKGDCEDFALFAHRLLKKNGIHSFLLNIYGDRFAHTVCVFREEGRYSVVDGSDVKHYRAANLQELMTRIYAFWKTGAIVSISPGKRGRILSTVARAD